MLSGWQKWVSIIGCAVNIYEEISTGAASIGHNDDVMEPTTAATIHYACNQQQ